ncbi:TetR/AcrR family transcriptional regulator [Bacillus gobiensis]|uniref:TetR/AcrR family transcriptional regulator n=1 Tax=Bacillus gobiensis TaxID=1441095 RepID=UPI003D1EDBB2
MKAIEAGTAERIIQAALQLMQNKGFKAVTIKEIAQASQVSEMTVFRHFGTKKGVFEAAVKKYSYLPDFKNAFDEKILWDIEKDLYMIAQMYIELMIKNQPIFLIAVQERTTMPELADFVSKQTDRLKEYLTNYFLVMQDKKKMIKTNTETQAMVFLTMLYGFFSSKALWKDQFIKESKEEFLQHSVAAFSNGLKNS